MDNPRRTTLGILLWGALATVAAPAIYVAARFLRPPRNAPSTARVGPADAIGPTDAPIMRVGSTDAVVMRNARGELYALNLRCTHAGCSVRPSSEGSGGTWVRTFVCPCHDGRFDREGNVIAGPPKRPLERLEVRVENGTVVVSDLPA